MHQLFEILTKHLWKEGGLFGLVIQGYCSVQSWQIQCFGHLKRPGDNNGRPCAEQGHKAILHTDRAARPNDIKNKILYSFLFLLKVEKKRQGKSFHLLVHLPNAHYS